MVDLSMEEPLHKVTQIELPLPGYPSDFKTLCPYPSAEQEGAWAARRFWQLANGESAFRKYKMCICLAMPSTTASFVDRSPPKLLAFFTYHDFEEHRRWIIKAPSVVTCTFELSDTSEHFCAFELASRTSIVEIDPKPFLVALPDVSLYGRLPVPPSASGNFKPTFMIRSTIWENKRTIADIPSWMATEIATWLPLPSVQSLAQAVPALRDVLDAEPARRIVELLTPYFKNPEHLIALLIKTGSIVTASIPLKAFQGSGEPWSPGDLDLVVPTESLPEVVRFLSVQDWKIDSTTTRSRQYTSYGDTSAPGPFQAGFQVYKKGTKAIDICSPTHMHPIDYVFTYHSTPPMAVFTGNSIGHLFPDLTLAHKLQRSTYGRTHRGYSDGDEGRDKYIRRGYKPVPDSDGLAVPFDADSRNVVRAVKGRLWRAKVVM